MNGCSKGSRRRMGVWAALLVVGSAALLAAGCGGDDNSGGSSEASGTPCDASIGVMTVLTGAAGPQGREMLHWAQLAVDQFNQENGTNIKVVEGDDQLDPAQAATVAQQWASDPKIVAVVGPESDSTVDSAGPILGKTALRWSPRQRRVPGSRKASTRPSIESFRPTVSRARRTRST